MKVLKPSDASNNTLVPILIHVNNKFWLKQDKVTFTHKDVVNIYIVYEIILCSYIQGADFILGNSLFGAVKLTRNGDPDKYFYFEYRIGFDARGIFRYKFFVIFRYMLNVITFVADMSSSVHIDSKTKGILILSIGLTDGLDDTTLTAEK